MTPERRAALEAADITITTKEEFFDMVNMSEANRQSVSERLAALQRDLGPQTEEANLRRENELIEFNRKMWREEWRFWIVLALQVAVVVLLATVAYGDLFDGMWVSVARSLFPLVCIALLGFRAGRLT